jgi:hypothetical protein
MCCLLDSGNKEERKFEEEDRGSHGPRTGRKEEGKKGG